MTSSKSPSGASTMKCRCPKSSSLRGKGAASRILLVDAPALARVGVAEDLLDAMTVQLSGARNESTLWLAQQWGNPSARDSVHRVLDRLLAAVLT